MLNCHPWLLEYEILEILKLWKKTKGPVKARFGWILPKPSTVTRSRGGTQKVSADQKRFFRHLHSLMCRCAFIYGLYSASMIRKWAE